MTCPPRGVLALAVALAVLPAALAQPPMPPDKQAEVALAAGQRAYNDGNLPVAAQKFQEVVQKFANTPSANPARYGLALCLINSPEQDFAKAARWFGTARDWFAGKGNADRAARCRCDTAEMDLRLGKVKEARAACEPFAKDAAL